MFENLVKAKDVQKKVLCKSGNYCPNTVKYKKIVINYLK